MAIVLGILFEKMNVSFLVGWAFSVAASANLPSLVMLLFWKGTTRQGITAAILVGMVSSLAWILLSGDTTRCLRPAGRERPRSLQPAGHRDDSAGIRGAGGRVAADPKEVTWRDWCNLGIGTSVGSSRALTCSLTRAVLSRSLGWLGFMACSAGEEIEATKKKKCAGCAHFLEQKKPERVRCALIEPGLVFEKLVKL